jgi:uncharacterized membrane protein YgaE (UPF0421/DUF939 family)
MPLSTQAKEAIKIGLAIVIGYFVALHLDLLSPTWVATSIAFISLPTAGQSLQKGALRLGGTLLGFVAGLFFLGLFPQDRWLFLLSFTPYLFFVAYMVQGRNGQYFWFVAGFVSLMITTAGTGSSEYIFQFAAYRSLETMMGIAIWTLVSVFIWPRSNLDALRKISKDLLNAHGQMVCRYRERAFGDESGEAAENEPLQAIRNRAGKMIIELEQAANAAAAESYQVHEVRRLWRRLHQLSQSAVEILDRLESGFSEMQKAALRKILLNEEALFKEIEERFEEARRILGGQEPSRPDRDVVIGVDAKRLEPLDHFERAAVESTRSELERLHDLVHGIVDCVRDIEGYEPQKPHIGTSRDEVPAEGPWGLPPIDPDRIRGAFMVTASMWVGFLIWIYVNPPGHLGWYQFIPSMALLAAQIPFVRPSFVKPFGYAYLVGLIAYVFIMPRLSEFWQLALLIFAFSFVAAYFFTGIGRAALFLAMFMMLGIESQQTYNFAAMANTFLFIMLSLVVLVALSYINRSPRPEKTFVSLVGRFFRSCEFLLSRLAAEQLEARSVPEQMKREYYLQELRTLPGKLRAWGGHIDPKMFPGASPAQVGDLVASLQILVYRMEDLIEARRAPHAEVLVHELTEDIRAWRLVIEENCRRWSERPEAGSSDDLPERLKARLATLNTRIEETLNAASLENITEQERGNFYRLLSGFRGFSEAALLYTGVADEIDWKQLREERF